MDKIKLPNKRFASIKLGGGIRDIVDLANKIEAGGKKVFHLEIGRPDFDSPAIAKEAAKKALDDGMVHYADMRGVLELRKALSAKLKRENSIIASENEILVTVGAQAALMAAMLASLDEGDEVIVPTPCFGAYISQSALLGFDVKRAPCRIEDGFLLKARDIEPLITKKTKLIVINTPNNPTGAVITRHEIEEIAKLAKKHDLLVISDECYERFLYEGEHVSIASLPDMADRTVTVGAASKTYSMTGWRVGYMVMPSWMTAYANRAHLAMNTCAATFPQYGYAAALNGAEGDVQTMISEYKERRDLVVSYLKDMRELDFVTPEGAFYVLPSVKRTGMSSTEFCNFMLEEAGVALVPGEAFESPGFVRVAYCKPKDYLREAMESMKAALGKLKPAAAK
ncbi:MAG: aminotransferase class I/II-fold pyridoxal phosphate-dependent enzyme [Synergistaceae bacterium]|nr:aminotransferase class I/II-fold pyridoxal phosphate-dependent enzyme [Synergistaceae bacterium]